MPNSPTPRQAALIECADAHGRRLTPASARVYLADLEHFPEKAVLDAFERGRRDCDRFPSIKLLRDFAGAWVAAHRARTERKNYERDKRFIKDYLGIQRRLPAHRRDRSAQRMLDVIDQSGVGEMP